MALLMAELPFMQIAFPATSFRRFIDYTAWLRAHPPLRHPSVVRVQRRRRPRRPSSAIEGGGCQVPK